jgi:hypothetical protein
MAKPARELPPLHRPSPVLPGARSKQHQVAGDAVGASKLAGHLDLTHPRIHQLVDEHVLERLLTAIAETRWEELNTTQTSHQLSLALCSIDPKMLARMFGFHHANSTL